jgi:hypothetical protein
MHPSTIRRIFGSMIGVIKYGVGKYRTLYIPARLLEETHQNLAAWSPAFERGAHSALPRISLHSFLPRLDLAGHPVDGVAIVRQTERQMFSAMAAERAKKRPKLVLRPLA